MLHSQGSLENSDLNKSKFLYYSSIFNMPMFNYEVPRGNIVQGISSSPNLFRYFLDESLDM